MRIMVTANNAVQTRNYQELAKRHKRQRSFYHFMKVGNKVFAYILMTVFTLSMIIPLIWMALCSLKTEGENLSYPPTILPQKWTLEHYKTLFEITRFPLWFRNSVYVSLGTTVIAVGISAMGAYAFSRFRYRFFEVFSQLILFAYMVPAVLLLIPIFKIVWSLKMANTLYGLMLVYNAFMIPFGLWTLRSYFAGIPHEIEEAAMIDGCSNWRAFIQVVIPQAVPGLISTALFSFHVAWNEYLYASILLWTSDMQTLSAGVATLMAGLSPTVSWGLLMAAGVMVTLPVIIIFSILQRYLTAGWGGGAVKG